MIGITPLLRYLKQQQNEIYVLTKRTGEEILRHNPNVDKLILHNDEFKKVNPEWKDDVPNDKLGDFFKAVEQAYEIDKTINLCESWEVKLARCPHEPNFKYPKQWAEENCDINYYEQIFKLAEIENFIKSYDYNIENAIRNGKQKFDDKFCEDLLFETFKPEMFFTEAEEIEMNNWFVDFRKLGKFVILWGLSGSAANKTYPYAPEVIFEILEKYPQVCFLTVGDEVCRILEIEFKAEVYEGKDRIKQKLCERIIRRSGQWSIRQSALACKYANLVIAPDTGILHASGMYDTPKIGLLNHSSKNNITKYFKNDYSIEAKDLIHPFFEIVSCSPCMRIHYQKKITCNLMEVKHTQVPICMGCLKPEIVIKRIEGIIK